MNVFKKEIRQKRARCKTGREQTRRVRRGDHGGTTRGKEQSIQILVRAWEKEIGTKESAEQVMEDGTGMRERRGRNRSNKFGRSEGKRSERNP